MIDRLEAASAKLLDRLHKERDRAPEAGATAAVGGMGKLGSTLEAMLRELLKEIADAQGIAADELLRAPGGAVTTDRATLGQLASALKNAARRARSPGVRHRAILRDLQQPASAIFRVVKVRNEAIHEATLARESGEVLDALNALVVRHRRDAGWG